MSRTHLFARLLLASLVWQSSVAEAQQSGAVDGGVDRVQMQTPAAYSAALAPLFWRTEVKRFGARYLRFQLSVSEVAVNSSMTIEIVGANNQKIEYAAHELAAHRTFWTPIIYGDSAVFSVYSKSLPTTEIVSIDAVAFQKDAGSLLSTWGGVDEKQHINAPTVSGFAKGLKDSVAWISYVSDGLPRVCTGFLINGNRLVTNSHCIASDSTCSTATIVFGYEIGSDGKLQLGEQFGCADYSEAQSSAALDFSVLQLDGQPSLHWKEARFSETDPGVGEELVVIQHPAGTPKRVSEINCRVGQSTANGGAPGSDFTHTCDTVTGSSGAPVFGKSGKVVGLHHFGFAEGGNTQESENRALKATRLLGVLQP